MGEAATAGWSIGEILRRLRPDFPDVTISKIRFLEAEGLVCPERAASGYRRFDADDLARLRYVLAVQRDHYLPLRVIKEHLDAMDRGLQPPDLPGAPRAPLAAVTDAPGPDDFAPGTRQLRLSAEELADSAGLDADAVRELQAYGLITPIAGSSHFDAESLDVARTVAGFIGYGLGPRHLKPFKTAADREIGLIEQIVTPMARQRGVDSAARASEAARELAALSVRLHAALVRAGLPETSG